MTDLSRDLSRLANEAVIRFACRLDLSYPYRPPEAKAASHRTFRSKRRARRLRPNWNNGIGLTANPALELLEQRRLLSAVTRTGAGGDNLWSDAANWSIGLLPGPSDDVVINTAIDGVVFVGGNDTIHSLHSSDPLTLSGGTLTVGSASAGGTVEVDNTFLLSGGTLADAAVQEGSGGQSLTATGSGGTLDGVTVSYSGRASPLRGLAGRWPNNPTSYPRLKTVQRSGSTSPVQDRRVRA